MTTHTPNLPWHPTEGLLPTLNTTFHHHLMCCHQHNNSNFSSTSLLTSYQRSHAPATVQSGHVHHLDAELTVALVLAVDLLAGHALTPGTDDDSKVQVLTTNIGDVCLFHTI